MKELMQRYQRLPIQEKRAMVSLVCFLAIIALSLFINNPAIVGVTATERELPIYCVQRDNKCASLSFDAAWGNISLGTLEIQA